jgi:GNAT superfamily N-acetyltransferase
MIRQATAGDLPAILALRDNAGAERLSDPLALTEALARRLIETDAVWIWQAPGESVAGFVAINMVDASIAALLVAPGQQGRGIGRALLAQACDALRATGHTAATLALEPATAAERHYQAAGWTASGCGPNGKLIFRKAL